jgi:hypothetical protein
LAKGEARHWLRARGLLVLLVLLVAILHIHACGAVLRSAACGAEQRAGPGILHHAVLLVAPEPCMSQEARQ